MFFGIDRRKYIHFLAVDKRPQIIYIKATTAAQAAKDRQAMDYKITITLNTDGAAFHEYETAIFDETRRALECVPVDIAGVIADDAAPETKPLYDYNGNKVGQIITTKENDTELDRLNAQKTVRASMPQIVKDVIDGKWAKDKRSK